MPNKVWYVQPNDWTGTKFIDFNYKKLTGRNKIFFLEIVF